MQHVGVQYGQGAANSHHPAQQFSPPEATPPSGSTTATLRQWRKKDATTEKQNTSEPQPPVSAAENQATVARVAPHAHYPRPPPPEAYRFPQYGDYGQYKDTAPAPVKYSEIVESAPIQRIEHIPPPLPKQKEKEYTEMCTTIQQSHLKPYPDHLNFKPYNEPLKHSYGGAPPVQSFFPKEPQLYPPYMQKEAHLHQYLPKDHSQFGSPYLQKYNTHPQYSRGYSDPNAFLKLNNLDPQMAIMNDHHLREPQIQMYHHMDQGRAYQQSQRMYRPLQHTSPTYQNRNIPQNYNPQHYNLNMKHNIPMHDPYRMPHYNPNMPKYSQEYKLDQTLRNISPRSGYPENVQYIPVPTKMSPNYSQCNQVEYAQHYRHRRPQIPQEYFNAQNKAAYMPNHPAMSENTGTKSNALKQYLESWNDDTDVAVENNKVDMLPVIKGPIRVKADGPAEQQLYVLGTTEISSENITQYLHLQQVEKIGDRTFFTDNGIEMPPNQIVIPNAFNLEGVHAIAAENKMNPRIPLNDIHSGSPEGPNSNIIRSYDYNQQDHMNLTTNGYINPQNSISHLDTSSPGPPKPMELHPEEKNNGILNLKQKEITAVHEQIASDISNCGYVPINKMDAVRNIGAINIPDSTSTSGVYYGQSMEHSSITPKEACIMNSLAQVMKSPVKTCMVDNSSSKPIQEMIVETPTQEKSTITSALQQEVILSVPDLTTIKETSTKPNEEEQTSVISFPSVPLLTEPDNNEVFRNISPEFDIHHKEETDIVTSKHQVPLEETMDRSTVISENPTNLTEVIENAVQNLVVHNRNSEDEIPDKNIPSSSLIKEIFETKDPSTATFGPQRENESLKCDSIGNASALNENNSSALKLTEKNKETGEDSPRVFNLNVNNPETSALIKEIPQQEQLSKSIIEKTIKKPALDLVQNPVQVEETTSQEPPSFPLYSEEIHIDKSTIDKEIDNIIEGTDGTKYVEEEALKTGIINSPDDYQAETAEMDTFEDLMNSELCAEEQQPICYKKNIEEEKSKSNEEISLDISGSPKIEDLSLKALTNLNDSCQSVENPLNLKNPEVNSISLSNQEETSTCNEENPNYLPKKERPASSIEKIEETQSNSSTNEDLDMATTISCPHENQISENSKNNEAISSENNDKNDSDTREEEAKTDIIKIQSNLVKIKRKYTQSDSLHTKNIPETKRIKIEQNIVIQNAPKTLEQEDSAENISLGYKSIPYSSVIKFSPNLNDKLPDEPTNSSKTYKIGTNTDEKQVLSNRHLQTDKTQEIKESTEIEDTTKLENIEETKEVEEINNVKETKNIEETREDTDAKTKQSEDNTTEILTKITSTNTKGDSFLGETHDDMITDTETPLKSLSSSFEEAQKPLVKSEETQIASSAILVDLDSFEENLPKHIIKKNIPKQRSNVRMKKNKAQLKHFPEMDKQVNPTRSYKHKIKIVRNKVINNFEVVKVETNDTSILKNEENRIENKVEHSNLNKIDSYFNQDLIAERNHCNIEETHISEESSNESAQKIYTVNETKSHEILNNVKETPEIDSCEENSENSKTAPLDLTIKSEILPPNFFENRTLDATKPNPVVDTDAPLENIEKYYENTSCSKNATKENVEQISLNPIAELQDDFHEPNTPLVSSEDGEELHQDLSKEHPLSKEENQEQAPLNPITTLQDNCHESNAPVESSEDEEELDQDLSKKHPLSKKENLEQTPLNPIATLQENCHESNAPVESSEDEEELQQELLKEHPLSTEENLEQIPLSQVTALQDNCHESNAPVESSEDEEELHQELSKEQPLSKEENYLKIEHFKAAEENQRNVSSFNSTNVEILEEDASLKNAIFNEKAISRNNENGISLIDEQTMKITEPLSQPNSKSSVLKELQNCHELFEDYKKSNDYIENVHTNVVADSKENSIFPPETCDEAVEKQSEHKDIEERLIVNSGINPITEEIVIKYVTPHILGNETLETELNNEENKKTENIRDEKSLPASDTTTMNPEEKTQTNNEGDQNLISCNSEVFSDFIQSNDFSAQEQEDTYHNHDNCDEDHIIDSAKSEVISSSSEDSRNNPEAVEETSDSAASSECESEDTNDDRNTCEVFKTSELHANETNNQESFTGEDISNSSSTDTQSSKSSIATEDDLIDKMNSVEDEGHLISKEYSVRNNVELDEKHPTILGEENTELTLADNQVLSIKETVENEASRDSIGDNCLVQKTEGVITEELNQNMFNKSIHDSVEEVPALIEETTKLKMSGCKDECYFSEETVSSDDDSSSSSNLDESSSESEEENISSAEEKSGDNNINQTLVISDLNIEKSLDLSSDSESDDEEHIDNLQLAADTETVEETLTISPNIDTNVETESVTNLCHSNIVTRVEDVPNNSEESYEEFKEKSVDNERNSEISNVFIEKLPELDIIDPSEDPSSNFVRPPEEEDMCVDLEVDSKSSGNIESVYNFKTKEEHLKEICTETETRKKSHLADKTFNIFPRKLSSKESQLIRILSTRIKKKYQKNYLKHILIEKTHIKNFKTTGSIEEKIYRSARDQESQKYSKHITFESDCAIVEVGGVVIELKVFKRNASKIVRVSSLSGVPVEIYKESDVDDTNNVSTEESKVPSLGENCESETTEDQTRNSHEETGEGLTELNSDNSEMFDTIGEVHEEYRVLECNTSLENIEEIVSTTEYLVPTDCIEEIIEDNSDQLNEDSNLIEDCSNEDNVSQNFSDPLLINPEEENNFNRNEATLSNVNSYEETTELSSSSDKDEFNMDMEQLQEVEKTETECEECCETAPVTEEIVEMYEDQQTVSSSTDYITESDLNYAAEEEIVSSPKQCDQEDLIVCNDEYDLDIEIQTEEILDNEEVISVVEPDSLCVVSSCEEIPKLEKYSNIAINREEVHPEMPMLEKEVKTNSNKHIELNNNVKDTFTTPDSSIATKIKHRKPKSSVKKHMKLTPEQLKEIIEKKPFVVLEKLPDEGLVFPPTKEQTKLRSRENSKSKFDKLLERIRNYRKKKESCDVDSAIEKSPNKNENNEGPQTVPLISKKIMKKRKMNGDLFEDNPVVLKKSKKVDDRNLLEEKVRDLHSVKAKEDISSLTLPMKLEEKGLSNDKASSSALPMKLEEKALSNDKVKNIDVKLEYKKKHKKNSDVSNIRKKNESKTNLKEIKDKYSKETDIKGKKIVKCKVPKAKTKTKDSLSCLNKDKKEANLVAKTPKEKPKHAEELNTKEKTVLKVKAPKKEKPKIPLCREKMTVKSKMLQLTNNTLKVKREKCASYNGKEDIEDDGAAKVCKNLNIKKDVLTKTCEKLDEDNLSASETNDDRMSLEMAKVRNKEKQSYLNSEPKKLQREISSKVTVLLRKKTNEPTNEGDRYKKIDEYSDYISKKLDKFNQKIPFEETVQKIISNKIQESKNLSVKALYALSAIEKINVPVKNSGSNQIVSNIVKTDQNVVSTTSDCNGHKIWGEEKLDFSSNATNKTSEGCSIENLHPIKSIIRNTSCKKEEKIVRFSSPNSGLIRNKNDIIVGSEENKVFPKSHEENKTINSFKTNFDSVNDDQINNQQKFDESFNKILKRNKYVLEEKKEANPGFKSDNIVAENHAGVGDKKALKIEKSVKMQGGRKLLIHQRRQIFKSFETSQKRRLSLEEYNIRKRKYSSSSLDVNSPAATSEKSMSSPDCNDTPHQQNLPVPVIEEVVEETALNNVPKISHCSTNKLKADNTRLTEKDDSGEDLLPVLTMRRIMETMNRESQSASSLVQTSPTISNKTTVENNLNKSNTVQTESERVKSLLDSLKLEIPVRLPRVLPENVQRPSSPPKPSNPYLDWKILQSQILIRKLCNKEALSHAELEQVQKIIRYKRALEVEKQKQTTRHESMRLNFDLTSLNVPTSTSTSTAIVNNLRERDIFDITRLEDVRKTNEFNEDFTVHSKSVLEERPRKKKRFRNLYTANDSDNESSISPVVNIIETNFYRDPRMNLNRTLQHESSVNEMNYSVYQSNGKEGVPKLIFRRRSSEKSTLQPVVKITRCNRLDDLAKIDKPT